jgi:hypothetical protein
MQVLGVPIEQWGNIANVVTALLAFLAFFSGLFAWMRYRRSLKRELINDMFSEYGKDDMWEAVSFLHAEFRKATKKNANADSVGEEDKAKWIAYYEENYQKAGHKLHRYRRRVSFFYQRIAFWAKGHYVKRVVREFWSQDDTFIVTRILLPIETVAMPELFNGKVARTVLDYNYPMWRMWRFWRRKSSFLLWRLHKLILRWHVRAIE